MIERSELLVLRALKMGDLLVSVPALRAIRRAFPEHRMTLAISPVWRPLVELVGGIDDILPTRGLDDPLDIEFGRIDTAINLHGNGPESRTAIEAIGARRVLGYRVRDWPGPEWRHEEHERERWTRLLTSDGIPADPTDYRLLPGSVPSPEPGAIVVHVGAFYGSRQWPVERFAAVARALAARTEAPLVFSGSLAERERAEEVAALAGVPSARMLAGELDLAQFAALIEHARLVVTADTGAAHLATAYERPSVVLFGPAPPEEWGPPADGPHIVLTDAALRRGETFATEPDPALLAVTVDQVLDAVDQLDVL